MLRVIATNQLLIHYYLVLNGILIPQVEKNLLIHILIQTTGYDPNYNGGSGGSGIPVVNGPIEVNTNTITKII